MSRIRTLLGFGILLLCLWSGYATGQVVIVPVPTGPGDDVSGKKTDSKCTYTPCSSVTYSADGIVSCGFTTTNAGWICINSAGDTCPYDAGANGSLGCVGMTTNTNPLKSCSYNFSCCSKAAP